MVQEPLDGVRADLAARAAEAAVAAVRRPRQADEEVLHASLLQARRELHAVFGRHHAVAQPMDEERGRRRARDEVDG
jgi:hypothetical protein